MRNKVIFLAFLFILFTSCTESVRSEPGGNVVTLDLNGGVFLDGSDLKHGGVYEPTPLKKVLSSVITPPVINNGKVFAVWNTASDGSGTDYLDDTMVTESVTLYAIYAEVIRTRDDMARVECGNPEKIYTIDRSLSLALGDTWAPLCPQPALPFKGKLYGKGNEISYFYTKDSDMEMPEYSGLFAYTEGAVIKDLKLYGVHVAGKAAAGALAGVAINTVIERVDVTGVLHGQGSVGGIAGKISNGSKIISSSFGNVTVHEEKHITISGSFSSAGGIAGLIDGASVISSSSSSVITASSAGSRIGGIAGRIVNGSIENSLHQGYISISGAVDAYAGGIAGLAEVSEISKCYTDSAINGSQTAGSASGGIAGYISNSKINDAAVFSIAISGAETGRIAGRQANSSVENSFARVDALVNQKVTGDGVENGTGKKITDMRKKRDFFNKILNMDFSMVWVLPAYYEFPRLWWENTPVYTRILSVSDLKRISKNPGGWYVLINDLDLYETDELAQTISWNPISTFTGRFDGNGKTIRNIYLSGDKVKGLFASTDNATVSDLYINVNINESTASIAPVSPASGGLSGQMLNTKAERVVVNGNIRTGQNTGAIAGIISGGDVAYCSANINISTHQNYDAESSLGGIAGSATGAGVYYSNASGSINSGSVNAAKTAGGIAGKLNNSLIIDSYSSVDIYASGGALTKAGGIAGLSERSRIDRCYSSGKLHASSANYTDNKANVSIIAGGISAYATGSQINDCIALCPSVKADVFDLKVNSHETRAAAIAGKADNSTVNNSYADSAMEVQADITSGPSGLAVDAAMIGEDFYSSNLGWDFKNTWKIPYDRFYPVLQSGI